MPLIKRLTYRPELITVASWLGLRGALRKGYYWWARPPDGILRLEVGGIGAQFYTRTPGELRNLDPAGEGQHEQHIVEVFASTLQSGGVFYDIGSNIGFYTVLLAKALGNRGEVIAFEPMGQSFAHLQDNLRLNGVTNVRSFQKALGNSTTRGVLHLGDENADSSLVRCPTGTDQGHELVELVEGDWFVEAENLPLPRAVKIDVEGYEYAVLQGLTHTLSRSTCELVCCEIHPALLPAEVKPELVLDLLTSLGFEEIEVRPRKDTLHALGRKAQASAWNEKT